MDIRIGQGFDAHRFKKTPPLILGGVKIPYEYGLAGHSDADVLTHAVIDSILGGLSRGNIGNWFPDSDRKYKNINSLYLLKTVLQSKKVSEYNICNLDTTVIAEKPKLTNYINEIQYSLADALSLSEEKISVKAKTTEKMGFCGRGEGIAVFANILLIRKN
ncbi:MAG: 2-C-methyl-D-erythritol 2,4-cyclodiphosphate synthase [Victivallales bacterium]|nr:2-C-methyl-D-erythritol 2,4-cyclodiphosphate synthase [Victivallales bacterium]MCF7889570.1 2-C-methyl-D-erythritol 2,4-cyclodiphosphate synthase [Victivallales bacterium]